MCGVTRAMTAIENVRSQVHRDNYKLKLKKDKNNYQDQRPINTTQRLLPFVKTKPSNLSLQIETTFPK